MPKAVFGHDYRFMDRKELLTFEELERVARVFVELGVEKIRLTGGEPLLRRELERLVEMLAAIDGLDLTLTTNASLLARKAQALRDAGLDRVNVSLDSLDDATFKAMNDVDFPVARVLEGIEAAGAVGLPVKVNAVVKRGVNDASVVDMARHFRGTGHTLRFIEYMDVGTTNGWRIDDVVPAAEIVEQIDAVFPSSRRSRPIGARSPSAGATKTARGDRRHHLGHPAVLRRLHPRAHLGRGEALHLPLREPGPRPPRPAPLGRDRRGARRAFAGVWTRAHRPLLRDPHREDLRPAPHRDVLHRRVGSGSRAYAQPITLYPLVTGPR